MRARRRGWPTVGPERGQARGGHAVGVGADVIFVARHAQPDRHGGAVRSLVRLEGREAELEGVPHLRCLEELRPPRDIDLAVGGMRRAVERGAELDRDLLLADAEAHAAGGDLRGGEDDAIVDLAGHRGHVLIGPCLLAGHGDLITRGRAPQPLGQRTPFSGVTTRSVDDSGRFHLGVHSRPPVGDRRRGT